MRIFDVREHEDVIEQTAIHGIESFDAQSYWKLRIDLSSGYYVFLTKDDVDVLVQKLSKEANNVQ